MILHFDDSTMLTGAQIRPNALTLIYDTKYTLEFKCYTGDNDDIPIIMTDKGISVWEVRIVEPSDVLGRNPLFYGKYTSGVTSTQDNVLEFTDGTYTTSVIQVANNTLKFVDAYMSSAEFYKYTAGRLKSPALFCINGYNSTGYKTLACQFTVNLQGASEDISDAKSALALMIQKVNTLSTGLATEVTTRATADTALDTRVTSLEGKIDIDHSVITTPIVGNPVVLVTSGGVYTVPVSGATTVVIDPSAVSSGAVARFKLCFDVTESGAAVTMPDTWSWQTQPHTMDAKGKYTMDVYYDGSSYKAREFSVEYADVAAGISIAGGTRNVKTWYVTADTDPYKDATETLTVYDSGTAGQLVTSANHVVVSGGTVGSLCMESGHTGNNADIRGGLVVAATAKDSVPMNVSGGNVLALEVTSGASALMTGGTVGAISATSATVSAIGGYISTMSADGATLTMSDNVSAGTLTVLGGTAKILDAGVSITNMVCSKNAAKSATVIASSVSIESLLIRNAEVYATAGCGVASTTVDTTGVLYMEDGALAQSMRVNSGGTATVSNGSLSSGTVASGGSLTLEAGNIEVYSTVIAKGGAILLPDGISEDAILDDLVCSASATINNVKFSETTSLCNAAPDVEIQTSGGTIGSILYRNSEYDDKTLKVTADYTADNARITAMSGANIVVASDTPIAARVQIDDDAPAGAITVNGLNISSFDNEAGSDCLIASSIVDDNATFNLCGGTLAIARVSDDLWDVTVQSGSVIKYNGQDGLCLVIAQDCVLSCDIDTTDTYISVVSGGTAKDIDMDASHGGNDRELHISSGGVALNVNISAGLLRVSAGGSALYTTVAHGDYDAGYLDIYSGGTATNTTVESAGELSISSGGVASNTVIKPDGSAHIYSKGYASAIDMYGGGAGSLIIENGGTVKINYNPWSGTITSKAGASVTTLYKNAAVYLGNSNVVNSNTTINLHGSSTTYNAHILYAGTLLSGTIKNLEIVSAANSNTVTRLDNISGDSATIMLTGSVKSTLSLTDCSFNSCLLSRPTLAAVETTLISGGTYTALTMSNTRYRLSSGGSLMEIGSLTHKNGSGMIGTELGNCTISAGVMTILNNSGRASGGISAGKTVTLSAGKFILYPSEQAYDMTVISGNFTAAAGTVIIGSAGGLGGVIKFLGNVDIGADATLQISGGCSVLLGQNAKIFNSGQNTNISSGVIISGGTYYALDEDAHGVSLNIHSGGVLACDVTSIGGDEGACAYVSSGGMIKGSCVIDAYGDCEVLSGGTINGDCIVSGYLEASAGAVITHPISAGGEYWSGGTQVF